MKKTILSLLVALMATTGATAQSPTTSGITWDASTNSGTFDMPAYDVEVSTELWYKLDATETLEDNQTNYGMRTDFFLDRTLTKDVWNTFASPFAIPADKMEAYFGAGAKVRKLDNTTVEEGYVLNLNFATATSIEAGKPYIIKWDATTPDYIENPEFTGVTISNATSNVPTSYADFIGTYSPIVWESENNSVLFLGSGNTLYFPQPSGSEKPHVNAFRGYFQLKGLTASEVSLARMNFDEPGTQTIIGHTEITEITEKADAAWYSLDGVKLDSKPSSKGIYIHGNKKVVVE